MAPMAGASPLRSVQNRQLAESTRSLRTSAASITRRATQNLNHGRARTPANEKKFVVDIVDRNSESIALLCDNIFYFAELGMQEFETSGLMMEILEKAGFSIERNLSGMPTGFVATYGSGKPVVALHTEFDATPACSQKPGVTQPTPIVDGAPGHTE